MIKISKIYIPLVERLIKLDNYEKIKAVVEIGMLGLDFIEEYNLNNSTKLNPQIRQQISEMNDKITNMVEETQHKQNLQFCSSTCGGISWANSIKCIHQPGRPHDRL